MRILGIGTDICHIPRIQRLLFVPGNTQVAQNILNKRFLQRCLHQNEIKYILDISSDESDKQNGDISYCMNIGKVSQYVASRWAAKEAIFKSIPSHLISSQQLPRLRFDDVEIASGPTGLQVRFHGQSKTNIEKLFPALVSCYCYSCSLLLLLF